VQSREHVIHGIENLAAVGRGNAGHRVVGDDATGQEFHQVECRADHRIVLAKRVGLGHGNVGVVVQRLDDAILTVDLMGRRKEFAGRFLAQDVHTPAAVGQVVGRIALATLELQDADRPSKAFDVRRHVVDEALFVEDMDFADRREIRRQRGRQLRHRCGTVVFFQGSTPSIALSHFFRGMFENGSA
jgi:hypothetical protein